VAKKYPLEPLVSVLDERERERAGGLRTAVEQADAERQALSAARERRRRLEAETQGERARERSNLEGEGARARDLQQGELYRIGAERALGALAAGEATQAARTLAADAAVASAKTALAQALSEKQVVERHHARFDRESERRDELAREEEAADISLALRRGARRD
jgi:hypothetical protein